MGEGWVLGVQAAWPGYMCTRHHAVADNPQDMPPRLPGAVPEFSPVSSPPGPSGTTVPLGRQMVTVAIPRDSR